MTPAQALAAYRSGRASLSRGRPDPPQEWMPYRRQALRAAVDLALQYLRGRSIQNMARYYGCTRQNIYGRIWKGIKFLEQRGHLQEIGDGGTLKP